ncbi:Acetyl-CoA synthetase (ADP-forming) alpha and beta chains, putative [Thioalkalivibrio nitratireducens DSM 14787]|uniref:Acetyl-CoA synthetase (ADP-forming) alpha and beta chains, putative n=1 Tax=Thioalkalivibrio nitratireducens (strain DSM 14787 / UNIQEM 213 / ALEN2) TaxID=1255043 RepID=L0DZX6_THIND|nr:bifunctional acetate--CoA ligase family protein/GNAT family N-acetyltransferase [Thioalkalivibrio nitratireducens]AGA34552.1 Acetyl-CoA synthetase (ADP-forming) alpha and beta chains, putative [Thioalkalivibrio nitratireducens DSM 14787]
MGPHYLNRILSARGIAVIGASNRPGSVGSLIFRNMLSMGYEGDLYAVNPKYRKVHGRKSYPDVGAIGRNLDLAVVATPASAVPGIIRECGQADVQGAIVISAGFVEEGPKGVRLQEAMLEAARQTGLRVIGPNCLGIMRPRHRINATFSRNHALPGHLALVSQSGAICTAILDWAEDQHIGFSLVASLGDAADVDFGDLLDFLALDPETRSILLYVEGIRHSRRFISGLRAAARMKPVIVIKSGRYAEGSRAAMSHTGALVGADDVFDAALERAGAVRAQTVQQMFSAASILSSGARVRGNRLAIVTNAGGPGVMATDRAVELDVAMAEFGATTMKRLDAALPPHWSHSNPVDLLGDADPARYDAALAACLEDPSVDGLLAMLTPQAMTDSDASAETVIRAAQRVAQGKPVLTCWMGGKQVEKARDRFCTEGLPHFITPEASVEAFAYLTAHQRNQRLLLQVPGPLSDRSPADVEGARMIIEGALDEGRKVLGTMESKAVLAAFRIPVTQTVQAHTASEALVAASTLGYPLAMKIASPDITHKSDVGGVRLNITTAEAVRKGFLTTMQEAREARPDARLEGVTLERMYRSHYGRELMVGVLRDPVFGPVISFGSGGTSVEVLHDRAVALPPLNETIIRGMIGRTRVARLLQRFRHMPPVDKLALEQVLLRISEMACELPEIHEVDINPLIVDENGLAAVDARVVVDFRPSSADRYAHMAIHPYPGHLVETWPMPDGITLTIRPIRPEDAQIEQAFVRGLSDESRYFRFMQAVHELTQEMLVRFTQIDYDRELGLIAVVEGEAGEEKQVAVARYTANPDQRSCEFAIVVADEWQGRGIGTHLMQSLMQAAKARGIDLMEGEVIAGNNTMLGLMRRLGFSIRPNRDDEGVVEVSRAL